LERRLPFRNRHKLEQELVILIDEKQGTGLNSRVVKDMRTQWRELDRRIKDFNEDVTFVEADEVAQLLVSIGVMVASALIAAIGKAESFANGRDLAAWLGLVPKQSRTGGKAKAFGDSNRGNKYLRKLLIHGAGSALPHLAGAPDAARALGERLARAGTQNIAMVALANKLARIAGAVLGRREVLPGQ
jgi:transposase